MKLPRKSKNKDQAMFGLVLAAGTPSLVNACRLLFIHGNDLTWGHSSLGLFLASVSTGRGFDEALEVTNAAAELAATRLLGAALPLFGPAFSEIDRLERQLEGRPATEKAAEIARTFAGHLASANLGETEKVIGHLVDRIGPLVGGLGSLVARSAVELRKRHLAITGMSPEEYSAMLYALARIGGVCDPVLRVAVAKNGFFTELAMAAAGFSAMNVSEGANLIEVFQVRQQVAQLKRGNDDALAHFISSYLNHHFPGERIAYACSLYGSEGKRDVELDVAIPDLDLGMEIKLYQSPFAVNEHKIETVSAEMVRQLPGYLELGCKRVLFVTNLPEARAQEALDVARQKESRLVGADIRVVGDGVFSLLPVLAEIGDQAKRAARSVETAQPH